MTSANFRRQLTTALCTVLLLLPVVSQAGADEEISALRAQLQALSERLDRLEAENQALAASNAELQQHQEDTTVAVAAVSEKTEAVEELVAGQAAESNWTDKISWKGDFRYRFEAFDIEGKSNRNRNRVRTRAALIADVTPDIEVGLGLASGGDDPVSTNQTLGGGGSTKGLNLDLAYFAYSGLDNTRIVGGKFSNYIHKAGKNALLYDGDWRPEGAGFQWADDRFFVNGLGTWIESDSNKDQSFAYLAQAGVKLPLGDGNLVAGIGYHNFDVEGSGPYFDDDFFGNSFDPLSNTYLHDYEELELFADFSFSIAGRPASVFANYVQNQAADDNDTGYAFGFNYGSARNKGEWAFGYVYQELQADAVLGLLTDSDYGGGGTDSKGHILKGSYALNKNFNANATWFINDNGLTSGDPIDYQRLQLDLSFKY